MNRNEENAKRAVEAAEDAAAQADGWGATVAVHLGVMVMFALFNIATAIREGHRKE